VEFVDHREYTPGDEPRTIDWKMLARTEKYFVKRFEMESNMNVVCMLDVSASMGYQPTTRDRLTKLEYACYLVGALCHLVNRQQDSPGLVTFDTDIREFVPPRQGKRHLFTLLARLQAVDAHSGTEVGGVLSLIASRLRRRGIVLLVSDCYGSPGQITDGVRMLRARGHDVILLHLMDHDEVQFPFKALAAFRDMETGSRLISDPLRLRRTYVRRLDEFRREIKEGTVGSGADYRFIDTSEPIEQVLRDYLLYRREQGR
jgi:uncharacterized protein (DUF58 family)